MVTLYVSAVAFTVLIFQYVNILIPDPLYPESYVPSSAYRSIRWAIASLVVVFPAYLWTSWFLGKSYTAVPDKRNLRIRKWLIYFTLFAAALIILGDLVTLVFRLLEGELTLRFVLKVFAVFFVAGSVFGYYLADIRKHRIE